MRFIRQPSEDTPRGHARDAVQRMILSRGYKVGDKLPTYRALAAYFGIAVRTVERVMRRLADEGTVQLLHGKGAFVRKLPAGSGQLAEVGLVYPASRWHLMQTSYLNQILTGMILLCDHDHVDLQIISLRAAGGPVPPRDLALRVDGMILLEVINDRYIAEFAQEAIPLVLVDAQAGLNSVPSICVDNAGGVQQVMDHLYALGHRRIAYVDALSKDDLARGREREWLDTADTRERREAYLAVLERLGLEYRRIYPPVEEEVHRLAESAAACLLRDPTPPTAILCYDDTVAGHLCRLLPAAGLRVPRDVSVAAAAGAKGGNVAGSLVVTGAIVDFESMGTKAIEVLRSQTSAQKAAGPDPGRVGSTLMVGTSVARPRRR